jgi:hypothetical protein
VTFLIDLQFFSEFIRGIHSDGPTDNHDTLRLSFPQKVSNVNLKQQIESENSKVGRT